MSMFREGKHEAAQSDIRSRDGGKLLRPEGIRHPNEKVPVRVPVPVRVLFYLVEVTEVIHT